MSNDERQPGRKPDLYATPLRDANKEYFNRIGAAWEREDGESYSVELDQGITASRFVLRKPKERLQELKDNARDNDHRDEKRDDKRGSGKEDRPARDGGPRYER